MKLIKLKEYANGKGEKIVTRDVLLNVLNQSQRGMLMDEVRKRCKMLDLLEAATFNHVIYNNDQFGLLNELLKTQMWSRASNELVACVDEILESEEPPAAMMKPANGQLGEKPNA